MPWCFQPITAPWWLIAVTLQLTLTSALLFMCSMFGSSFEACAAVFSTALTPFYTVPDVSAVSHHTSQRAHNAAAGSLEATLNRRYRPLKDAEPRLWLGHYHKWGRLHGGLRDYHLGWLYLGKCQHESIWVEIVDLTLLSSLTCPTNIDHVVLTDETADVAGSLNPKHL